MKKRPVSRMPAPQVQGSRLKFTEALQNPPNEWQQWLRAGVLCRLKYDMFVSTRSVGTVPYVYADTFGAWKTQAGRKGQFAMCLREASRTKVPDPSNPRRQIVKVEYEFLFSTGIYVADPRNFEEGDRDDTV